MSEETATQPTSVRPSHLCPRQDMLGELPAQRVMRKVVKKLPRYCTFDHSFHSLREDEKFWYLRTKPIRNETKSALEIQLALPTLLQRPEPSENVRKEKLKPKDYDALADAIERALPIREDILRRNNLEKKVRSRGDLESLRLAVSAAKASAAALSTGTAPAFQGLAPPQTPVTGGPTAQKNAEDRLQYLIEQDKRVSQR